ncbi:trehalase-domain-containing protein [Xylariomycetidae sp. FL0641]|nr:trehalase-domain-containing protein [Xylariomycetidae sp. FL0641]
MFREESSEQRTRLRYYSQDDTDLVHRSFLIHVPSTMRRVLEAEDTSGNKVITVDCKGPKWISLGSLSSDGYRRYDVRGTYPLAILLQDLLAAHQRRRGLLTLDTSNLREDPVARIQRKIKDYFWPNLIRRLDADVVETATRDNKWRGGDDTPRIFVPTNAPSQVAYYTNMAKQRADINLQVVPLPGRITREKYKALMHTPGILALDTEAVVSNVSGETEQRAVPFIVPGGRFNEGWDSYFIGLGLLADGGSTGLALVRGIVQNWIFEIQHYGIIPNANRSYFLLRSQPPFLTDLSLRLYDATKDQPGAKAFLRRGIEAAMREYHGVWTCAPRLDPATGLSRYNPDGWGIPMEVEEGHFDDVLAPYAAKYGLTIDEFTRRWNEGGEVGFDEPQLEEFLRHDRGVRESGHDTSFRLTGRAADLAIVDLNCCLYKYERDIARAIREVFDGHLGSFGEEDASAEIWEARAARRKEAVDKFLWSEERGLYVDYNVVTQQQLLADSVTTLWPLWCGLASPQQAAALVGHALPLFECEGGLAASSAASHAAAKGKAHQWDYPYGWAPHQMLAWEGLAQYGYGGEARRLAYRWLRTVIKTFVDFDGAVFEKYHVARDRRAPHDVAAEYGNQGNQLEGFGWTNASVLFGLAFLDRADSRVSSSSSSPAAPDEARYMRWALGVCAPYEALPRPGGK